MRRWIPCLLPFLFACASTPGTGIDAWHVASDLDNPPFAWVDEAGIARGRDVEMAQRLAEEMGLELVWERMEFAKLLDALEAREVDAVIATLGATPERAERVLLSSAYFVTSLRVVARRGDGEPRKLDDLNGLTVSAGVGTTSEQALRSRLPEAIPASASDKGASSLERLLSRDVDALVMDGPDALDYAREHPADLRLIEPPLCEERYVVALRPDAQERLAQLDAVLARLRDSGYLIELDRRFGLAD